MAIQNRKDQLKALFVPVGQPSSASVTEPAVAASKPEPIETLLQPKARSSSGAVKAMGLSLGGLSKEIEEARRLKESLGSAERIVEIDTRLVDTSFVSDRLEKDDTDADFQALVKSIEASGQQVPVLLRPHPETSGRYQTAYGHRRVRAAALLGIPVRAIVRPLSDVELVLAQGKENSERRDLSFIERALFAHELIRRGFERGLVQEALSLHKAEMTRFLQVAEAVPVHIVQAIGAAPKIGRPRWMALADLLKGEAARVKADDEVTSARFRAAPSDERFNLLFTRLQRKSVVSSDLLDVVGEGGRTIARVTTTKGKARVEFVDKMAEGFDDFLRQELPELVEKFLRQGAESA